MQNQSIPVAPSTDLVSGIPGNTDSLVKLTHDQPAFGKCRRHVPPLKLSLPFYLLQTTKQVNSLIFVSISMLIARNTNPDNLVKQLTHEHPADTNASSFHLFTSSKQPDKWRVRNICLHLNDKELEMPAAVPPFLIQSNFSGCCLVCLYYFKCFKRYEVKTPMHRSLL